MGRSVNFSSRTQDQDLYPGLDTKHDEVAPHPASSLAPSPTVPPVSPSSPTRAPAAIPHYRPHIPHSPAHILLSSVTTEITVPLTATPNAKLSGKLATMHFWTTVDLETVSHASEMEIDDDGGLTEMEKESSCGLGQVDYSPQGEALSCGGKV
ncbi:hypothetical protein L873DRAFT_1503506 [Choiromyces venosus 120613-1]|uniref:Uncharacterized protein n=1 Tax=Choiromyces venosus 120613-1 TaxID=1336337 RepID=A0A3N4IVM7_9PEZI|nr:hypothetical protein L873DRAFT_1503506 [Choiromyces venosus 120613-1]